MGAPVEKRARQWPVKGEVMTTGEAGLEIFPLSCDKGRTRASQWFHHVVFQHPGIFSCFLVRAANLPSWNLNKDKNKLLNKRIDPTRASSQGLRSSWAEGLLKLLGEVETKSA